MNQNELKILIVGDSLVGKSSIMSTYSKDPINSSASVLSIYRCNININNSKYELKISDICGSNDKKFENLRKGYYSITQDIDVIMMCFSMVDPDSLYSLKKKWFPEIKESYSGVPILLIGTKKDRFENLYRIEKSDKTDLIKKLQPSCCSCSVQNKRPMSFIQAPPSTPSVSSSTTQSNIFLDISSFQAPIAEAEEDLNLLMEIKVSKRDLLKASFEIKAVECIEICSFKSKEVHDMFNKVIKHGICYKKNQN